MFRSAAHWAFPLLCWLQPGALWAQSREQLSSPPVVPRAPQAADAKAEPPFTLRGEPGSGVTADFGEAFSLNVKARLQLRYQLDATAPDATGDRELQQSVSVGTARIWLGGHVFTRDLTYLIQLAVAARDYRDGATSPLYDAYLDWKLHRDLALKAGQYFVPFDRLRTIKESALQISDRARPVAELTLDRDVGVTAYSEHFLGDKSPVAYRLGAFGGGGMNLSTGKTPGVLVVGRLELRPFGEADDDSEGDLKRRTSPGLAVGVAGAANIATNRARSTTGPVYAAGTTNYYHGAVDGVFKWHGFALEAEGLVREGSVDTIVSADPAVPNEQTRSGYGWVAQASYIFPLPIELVGRLSGLYAMPGTDPAFVTQVEATGQEVGCGVNYYLNGHKFKIQADYLARMPHGFVFGRAEQSAHLLLDFTL